MKTQSLIERTLVAASVAEQNGFDGTRKALIELVALLQTQQKEQDLRLREHTGAAHEEAA